MSVEGGAAIVLHLLSRGYLRREALRVLAMVEGEGEADMVVVVAISSVENELGSEVGSW